MQLTRLEVTNWRGLASEIVEFAEGVTIVGGPNESGKSSLRGALRAALLSTGTGRGEKKAAEAHRPWGTRLNPTVTVDFRVDDEPWSLRKEFLAKKGWAELRTGSRLIAQDDEAQAKLLELLGPVAEWIDVLWGEQGESKLQQAPESLKGRLAAAAQDTVMPQVARLQELISEDYLQYWQEKRGLPNIKVQRVRDVASAAQRSVQDLKNQLEAANQETAELDRRQRELEALKQRRAKLQEELQAAQASRGAWEAYERALSDVRAAETAATALEQWVKTWRSLTDSIQKLEPEAIAWTQKENTLKSRLGAAPSRASVDELTARQKYLELALGRDRRAAIEALRVPPPAELKTLQTTAAALAEIEARLKVGEMRAVLTAETSLEAQVQGQTHRLAAGGTATWTAEKGFELVLPGVARLEVQSGNPEQDVTQRGDLQRQLAESLARWDATTLAELQERAMRKDAALKQTPAVDARQVERARENVADASTLDTLDPSLREALLAALPQKIAEADAEWKTAQTQYQQTLDDYNAHARNDPSKLLAAQRDHLKAHLENAPPGQDWPHLLQEKQAEVMRLKGLVVRPEGTEVTRQRLDQVQGEMKQSEEQFEKLRTFIDQTIGKVSAQGDLYSRLVLAEEALARAEADEKRINLDAGAARELHLAFETAKASLQRDVLSPLQSRVRDRLSSLTRGFYSDVTFDPTLRLGALATPTVASISLDDVSFGTREQLSLLTRLCLAELLADTTCRQVLILDDNLVHTDAERMLTACRLLEDISRAAQIVVFTCHPERYRSIASRQEVAMSGRQATQARP